MRRFKKIAAVAMSVCMTLGIMGDANIGLEQQVNAADKVISKVEMTIPDYNVAAGYKTGDAGGAKEFQTTTEGVTYASFGITSYKDANGEVCAYNGITDVLVEGREYNAQISLDLQSGYTVADTVTFILHCKDVDVAIDMPFIEYGSLWGFMVSYKIKSLETLKSESKFVGATVANSGDGLKYPKYSDTGSIYKKI